MSAAPTLAALQQDFRAWLIDAPSDIGRWIEADAQPGLAVYHNAYRAQLCDALAETFERTHGWIGDEAFLAAARAHIESTPPHAWTMDAYGEGFDRTLAALHPDDPEIAELAWLDRALARSFSGVDAAPIDPATLADIDWDDARLIFTPTLTLAPATTNAGAIWSALSAQSDPPAAALLPEAGAMLVWRQGFTPCFRTTDATEHRAIALMLNGARFGDLCATLTDTLGEADGIAQAGASLGQWLRDGLIIGIVPGA